MSTFETDKVKKSGRILMVRNTWDEISPVRLLLEKSGRFELSVAYGGEAAFEALEDEEYDLVVTDVAMIDDKLSGFGLIRRIKQVLKLPVPVMIVTHRLAPEIRQVAFDLEVDAFLSAPFDSEFLIRIATELVAKSC